MNTQNKNTRLALSLLSIAAGMVMLAYASVPLYRIFCEATGFGGTPKTATEASQRIMDRKITIRFDSNTANNLSWKFMPEQNSIQTRIGENTLAFFDVVNNSNEPIVGMATYNVTPEKAAPYFMKLACFCYEPEILKAKEKKKLPVSFYIDPEIEKDRHLRDVSTITLSYTFFKYEGKDKQKSAAKAGKK